MHHLNLINVGALHKQVHDIVNRTERINFSNLSKDIGERIDRFKRTYDIAKLINNSKREQMGT